MCRTPNANGDRNIRDGSVTPGPTLLPAAVFSQAERLTGVSAGWRWGLAQSN